MTCLACEGTGKVLAFQGRPLSVSLEHGRERLDFFRRNRMALLVTLEDLTDDDELKVGAIAAVHYAYKDADWSSLPCPWCPVKVTASEPRRDDEEWLRGGRPQPGESERLR